MQLWKLTLAYDGTGFHGWQVQPRLATIQGVVSAAIHKLTGEHVLPQGSGRTDAGVHALAQVATFSLQTVLPPTNLQRAMNRALPQAIRVLHAEHAPNGFHARYSATSKTYEYRLFSRVPGTVQVCSPFLAPYAWNCPWDLDLGLAQRGAADLVGEYDFTSFAAVDPELRHNRSEKTFTQSPVRRLMLSAWFAENDFLVYRVTGSGFLHHMVRNIVGTLVDIARGRTAADAIPKILAARSRSAAGPTAPAHGLFLVRVDYRQVHPEAQR